MLRCANPQACGGWINWTYTSCFITIPEQELCMLVAEPETGDAVLYVPEPQTLWGLLLLILVTVAWAAWRRND